MLLSINRRSRSAFLCGEGRAALAKDPSFQPHLLSPGKSGLLSWLGSDVCFTSLWALLVDGSKSDPAPSTSFMWSLLETQILGANLSYQTRSCMRWRDVYIK